jgi:hypothetical protein
MEDEPRDALELRDVLRTFVKASQSFALQILLAR